MKGVYVLLRQRAGTRAPYLVVRAPLKQLVAALGEPVGAVETNETAYRINGLRLQWMAGGALTVEGDPSLLITFVDVLVERFRQFNTKIIVGVYGCASLEDWNRFCNKVTEKDRVPLLEELVVRDWTRAMTVGQWSLLPW